MSDNKALNVPAEQMRAEPAVIDGHESGLPALISHCAVFPINPSWEKNLDLWWRELEVGWGKFVHKTGNFPSEFRVQHL